MIKIEKNLNFSGFFNVFAFGKFVEQVQGRAKAVALASQLAKESKQDYFVNNKKIEEVK